MITGGCPRQGKRRMPEKVLIIEGKQVSGRKLTAALTRAGFSVACVPNQPVLAFALGEFSPDMIIVDNISMEGESTQRGAGLLGDLSVPVFRLGHGSGNLPERLESALRQHKVR
jgi:hypothetical protein